jgi:hypothetical protein
MYVCSGWLIHLTYMQLVYYYDQQLIRSVWQSTSSFSQHKDSRLNMCSSHH